MDTNEKIEPVTNFFNSPKMSDFIGSKNPVPKKSQNPQTSDVIKSNSLRLNDYDSNILNEKASWEKEDEKLKPEFLIREKEKELADIKKKMRIAEEVDNRQELFSLRVRKQRVDDELRELYRRNSKTSALSTFTGKDVNIPVINKIKTFVSRNILAKVSKKFNSIMDMGDSLEKLANINRSVDELMTMKVPYGENSRNYEQLTEYLYQANKIRSQITKNLGN